MTFSTLLKENFLLYVYYCIVILDNSSMQGENHGNS